MKTDVPTVIQTLSSRACTYARKDASRSSCQPAACTSKQRRFCMLCAHCPKCVDNPHGVSCDLCDACSACTLQTGSS
ncbi:MAG: hypothetical protein QE570_05370 [Verrucomicrobiota bacterium]|jgi:hypothetical protein|nr:hypothetical protein [Verrucomicrobiota bacterium]